VSGKFGDTVHRLTKFALERNPEYEKTARATDHYGTKVQRTLQFTKDAVNYAFPYRGFSMSIEGSRVIRDDKKQKVNNLWIAELTKQRYWDEMHPKIMAQIMQIAMGLGMAKSEQADMEVQKGVAGLKDLVGEERAQSTLTELCEWKNELNIPETVYEQSPRDVDTTERIYANSLKTAADGDPLISEVFKRVKKFDHGPLVNALAGLVEADLSAVTILSGNPGISLAAEGASTAFVMATGGPEENKILKELYFGRRLEIRRKRISDETELALMNYEKALLTHNGPQLAMSEVVLAQLVGPERIPTVLERNPINDFALTAPIELGKMSPPDERAALAPSNPNIAPTETIASTVSGTESQMPPTPPATEPAAPGSSNPNIAPTETIASAVSGAESQMPPTPPTTEPAAPGSNNPSIASTEKIASTVSGAESQMPPTPPTTEPAAPGSNNPNIAPTEKIASTVSGAESQMPPTPPTTEPTAPGSNNPDIVPIKKIAFLVSPAESERPSPTRALPHHCVHVRHKAYKQRHRQWRYVVLAGHTYTTYGF
jgi:hypothetical protein